MKILGISGALRKGSFNAALLRAAVEECPVGLIGASPGMQGTVLSQAAWLQVLRALGMRPWFGQSLYVGSAGKVFDASGKLVDDAIRARLRKYLQVFADAIA